jgi:hypothetical protein
MEEVVWRGGLRHDEVVWPVAQEASVEGMVAGVGCWRKKEKVCRGERESPRAAWWPVSGCVSFLWWSWWQTSWW